MKRPLPLTVEMIDQELGRLARGAGESRRVGLIVCALGTAAGAGYWLSEPAVNALVVTLVIVAIGVAVGFFGSRDEDRQRIDLEMARHAATSAERTAERQTVARRLDGTVYREEFRRGMHAQADLFLWHGIILAEAFPPPLAFPDRPGFRSVTLSPVRVAATLPGSPRSLG